MDYWDILAERAARREANKKAWAERAARQKQEAVFRERRLLRAKGHRPRGKSMIWTQVAAWAEKNGCEGTARTLRGELMPDWQPGDNIPLAIVKEIVRGCMRKKGERRLARLESEHQSSLPKES